MKHQLLLFALIGCAEPTTLVQEQGLACAVSDQTEEMTAEMEPATSLRSMFDGFDDAIEDIFGPDPGECSEMTINGHFKQELCWSASATLDDIKSCLQDLLDGTTPERQTFCEALIANHEVVMCGDYDFKINQQFRDSTCKLVKRSTSIKQNGCFQLSDDAKVPHPTRCTTVLEGTLDNKKVGNVKNCPRCESCNSPTLEL